MVEVVADEQNQGKKSEKNSGELWRPLGQYLTHQHLSYRGPRRRREKESH